ncbi:helix-turn-helix domain-containing protein [Dactylosporangium sp. CA-233914]|uniref:helix-turn-helix domain-containing protein n=1 Tax=Dactylosporangium sp. CA-233914 TaxID=3239934 RepID=UPI003D90A9E6
MQTAAARTGVVEIRTREKEMVVEAINNVVAHRARITLPDPALVDLSVRSRSGGGFGALHVGLTGVGYAATTEPFGTYVAGVVEDGGAEIRIGRQVLGLGPGDGWLYPLGVPSSGEYGRSAMAFLSLPVPFAADFAATHTGVDAADLRFEGLRPISEAMRQYWAVTASFLSRRLTVPDAELPPLIATQLWRVAAAAMLAVFPNTTMAAARTPSGGRVAPAVVRRAVAFMDAHPERPLTVTEVAAAAGVGARGLQVAFRRHLGHTPMEYLRRVRLERVHRELQSAVPGDGVTVRETARRWGFANPGRFSAEYRAAYDQTPSRTLRT